MKDKTEKILAKVFDIVALTITVAIFLFLVLAMASGA